MDRPDSLDSVLTLVREIVDRVVAPAAEEIDRDARWPEAGIRALQGAGLGGLVAPRKAGGLELGLLALARVGEELGRGCGSTAICFGMHCVATAVIAAKATPLQTSKYLAPIAAGTHLTTLALSEPGTGSHFYLPEATLERGPGGSFVVDGTKSFATNGAHADSMVISVAADASDVAPGTFSCLVAQTHGHGVEWIDNAWRGWGMRGNAACSVRLRKATIGAEDLLGREGDQIWYVFHVIAPYFLMAMAGTYLGIVAGGLDEARAHLQQRRHNHTGATLSSNTVLQHRLGTLWAEVERTRRLIYYAAAAGDAGLDEALPALFSAKAEAATCATNVLNECMTLLGGIGYRESSSMQRRLRDARAAHVMAPTTDILRTWAGRALLGLPILGD